MGGFSKVRVNFCDESLVDFDQMVHDIQDEYSIGYAGLFRVDERISLFIQRAVDASTRMALGKIKKICSKLAAVDDVTSFETREGERIESFGEFRPRGAKTRGLHVDTKSHNNTTKTTTSHNNTNNNKMNSKNTTRLHINALGEEDISHITKEDLEDAVGMRDRDEAINHLKTNLSLQRQRDIMKRFWRIFRRHARKQVREYDERHEWDPHHKSSCESLRVPRAAEDDSDLGEDDYNFDEFKDADKSDMSDMSDDEEEDPPIYDWDSDSDENRKRKLICLDSGLEATWASLNAVEFMKRFEELIFDNPHNSNIAASTKEKYFKYYDGRRWIKLTNAQYLDEVTVKRINKAEETLKKLINEGKLSDFARRQVSAMVKKLLGFYDGPDYQLYQKENFMGVKEGFMGVDKDGILAAENNEAHLALVGKILRRRIVRVGQHVEDPEVIRNSTWSKLKNMS